MSDERERERLRERDDCCQSHSRDESSSGTVVLCQPPENADIRFAVYVLMNIKFIAHPPTSGGVYFHTIALFIDKSTNDVVPARCSSSSWIVRTCLVEVDITL